MSGLFIVITVGLILIVIIQVSKTIEYIAILKGEEKSQSQSDKVNATFMILFLIFGLIGVYLCHKALKDKLLPRAASVQGAAIDHMMWVTLIITGIVFFGTQILLFYFTFRFRARPGHQATYIPQHSSRNGQIEVTWTSITLIALLVLIIIGLKHWFKITGPAPANAMVMEVTGQQFNWLFRYPGRDGELGKKNYRLVNAAKSNPLGQDWSDKANKDDIVSNGTMHLVVGRPVKLLINSLDVVHDVGMPHFRLKMDAVPGVPTSLWFTPTITTEQMKKITGDPNFVYELACDQLCGNGHYSMRATIIVETQDQFNQWIASQQSQYQLAMSSPGPVKTDTAKQKNTTGDSTRSMAAR